MDNKQGRDKRRETCEGDRDREWRGGDNEGSDKVKVFPHMSNSPQINSPLSLIFIRIFLGALTCRGPPAGIVDLSDVRSMSRPWSPLSVFPSPCIIRAVSRAKNTQTHTQALSVAPAAVKMLMHGWQCLLWKEITLDARHRVQARGDRGRDKQTVLSLHLSLHQSLSPTPSVSVAHSSLFIKKNI